MRYLIILFFIITSTYANLAADDLIFQNLPYGKDYDVSIGTGFFVDNHTIITNGHVVDNCLSITIRNANYPPQKAVVSAIDHDLDLALLKTSYDKGAKILLWPESPSLPQIDDTAYINLFSSTLDENHLLKPVNITKIDDVSFYFSGNMEPGNSGSPLFNQNMDIVGILTARFEIFDFYGKSLSVTNQALSINQIKKFIANNNIIFYKKTKLSFLINSHDKPDLFKIHCVR